MNRILVVDDEPNIRFVYKEVLNEEGFEVAEAESVNETFDILNRENIDLVVLDIKLRSESGLDILHEDYKRISKYSSCIVLGLRFVSKRLYFLAG